MCITTTDTLPKNIDLARELIAHISHDTVSLYEENIRILEMLDGGELSTEALPGETFDDIVSNLRDVIVLAREPVALAKTGRKAEADHYGATRERNDLLLFARVALGLLTTP